MTIYNLTTDKATYTTKTVANKTEHIFNFGSVKQGNPATFKARIENVKAKSVRVGCTACTKVKINQTGADAELEVTYDSKVIGFFNKTVVVTLQDDTNIIFKITGTVK